MHLPFERIAVVVPQYGQTMHNDPDVGSAIVVDQAKLGAHGKERTDSWMFTGIRLHSISRERGSRSCVSPPVGDVTKGPPARGAAREKATSGVSLSLPARGKSLRSGWNG